MKIKPLNEHLFGYDKIENLTIEEWYDIQDQVWAERIGLTDFNQKRII